MLILILALLVVPSLGGWLPYIIRGDDVEPAGKWPWQGSVRNWWGNHVCGCSLVSANWVITAAHCLGGSVGSTKIILGAHDIKTLREGEPTTYGVSKKIAHEGFVGESRKGYPNDIGLIRLSTPAKLDSDYIGAVALARPEDGDFSGSNHTCYITGWGADGGLFRPNILQEAQILALDNDVCQEIFGSRIGLGHICVHYMKRGACSGDSGGPLVCHDASGAWRLVGVTSWGKAACTGRYPSVYTRVSHYRGWLNDNSDGEL